MKKKFNEKEEFEAEIRNKLTMPLTVLSQFMKGKRISKKDIKTAINCLNELLKSLQG